MIHITINGKPVEAEEGTTIMAAAESVGIRIPSLCHMKNVHQHRTHLLVSLVMDGEMSTSTAPAVSAWWKWRA